MIDHLAPFEPSAVAPWDHAAAAHLARRAGFGVPPTELGVLVALGPSAAVERFVDFPNTSAALEDAVRRAGSALATSAEAEAAGGFDAVRRMRQRWLFRMVHSPHALHEKLTLFWHDHFATAQSKVVRAPLLEGQLAALHTHAAGRFRDLIGAIARDPAMLVLLDNRLSTKERPNENWARELLELYTLGLDRYTQEDIVALARIFTGWTTPTANTPEFVYRADAHDPGDKQLFGAVLSGRSGAGGLDEGEAALDHIVARPDCAAFLADKLARWFVSHDPAPEPVAELTAVLQASELDLRVTLRALFRSRWFHAPEHRFALYKNPVELAVGTLRLLEVQNAHLAGLERLTRTMGMELFEPPSVAGWEHGRGWVDSGSAIQRFNFALEVSELPHTTREVEGRPALNLDALAGGDDPTPRELLDGLEARLLGRALLDTQRAAILEYLGAAAARDGRDTSARGRRRARVRGALHLILTAPQFAMA